jgi:hypothetical protein
MAHLAYLLAASHSGSTLLAMLLGAHRDAATVGELKATSLGNPDQYRCSCGSLLKSCEFWLKVNARMAEKGIPFQITQARTSIHEVPSKYAHRLLKPLYRDEPWETARDIALSFSPAWRRHLKETQQRNLALVETLHELTGAKIIIDSSKLALRAKYLLRADSLEIKIIRLIRDGRGVSLTYTDEWNFADASNPALRAGGTGDIERKQQNRPMSEAAREWRRSNEAADALVKTLSTSQYLQVKYEDLCSNPDSVLQTICEFLKLDPARLVKNFRSVEKHVVGNGCRFDTTSDIRLDDRWKTHLSKEDLQTFDAVAGDLNRKYGYN